MFIAARALISDVQPKMMKQAASGIIPEGKHTALLCRIQSHVRMLLISTPAAG